MTKTKTWFAQRYGKAVQVIFPISVIALKNVFGIIARVLETWHLIRNWFLCHLPTTGFTPPKKKKKKKMAATNAKLNLLTLWSLIRMLMMSLAWQLLVCHHRLMLEQHSTFSTTKIINNPLKINRNVSPCQSKKTTKLLHTLQYPALPEHHSLKDSLMVILAMEPVWHLGSYRWPLYLDTEEIQLHSSWQPKKKLNFTICLRKQGLKKQQQKKNTWFRIYKDARTHFGFEMPSLRDPHTVCYCTGLEKYQGFIWKDHHYTSSCQHIKRKPSTNTVRTNVFSFIIKMIYQENVIIQRLCIYKLLGQGWVQSDSSLQVRVRVSQLLKSAGSDKVE